MNYQEVEFQTSEGLIKFVQIVDENNNAKLFPADLDNPEYKAWAIAEGLIEPDPEPEIVEETPASAPVAIVIEQ